MCGYVNQCSLRVSGHVRYINMTTRTYEVYKGLPLSDMSPQERGTVIQNVVRRHLEEKYETTATSPTGERCVNGRKRGWNSTTHEFFSPWPTERGQECAARVG